MCRIAGLVGVFSENLEREICIKSMCNSMAHGGPDDEGFFYSPDDRLVLGNRRLSLVDLSKNGHMPMTFESR
ncbi:MAG: asparagine synthetase B, partial [Ferruginibacter sp.]|nr:asparagine synthetase B [Ferruginibacter sp.]